MIPVLENGDVIMERQYRYPLDRVILEIPAGKLDAPDENRLSAIQRELPEIQIGDLLVIHDTGAHGYSMGYNYNGRTRSAEILHTAEGGFRMIRRAETAADYFATLDIDEAGAELVKR